MNKISPDNIFSKNYNVIIIGGGASGLFAASNVDINKKVLIIEKNDELGKKLKITGGGRCNIFNYELDTRKLLNNYGTSSKYLFSPFSIFGVKESEQFFNKLGIKIKVENNNRAFPTTERAIDVYEAIYNRVLNNKNVDILLNSELIDIILENKNIKNIIINNKIDNKNHNIIVNKIILSTGGYSHSYTGSDGKVLNLLKKLNIKVEDPTPSLVPIKVSQAWVNDSSGVTIKDVKLDILIDNKKVKTINNKSKDNDKNINILCTHFGFSGPSIINNSKFISDYLKEGEVKIKIDLFRNMNEKELDEFILSVFDNNKNKKLKNVLYSIYEGKIIENIFNDKKYSLCNINIEKQVNDINKLERKLMVQTFKNLEVVVSGLLGLDNSIIADGGISVDEVDFKNMNLKNINNVYVTGDMLNISRPSGGYSLQLCWTTGYIAGVNM